MATRNPKDSMKSTWRRDKSQWTFDHKMFHFLDVYHTNLDQPVPVHAKTDPVPYLTEWTCHVWILVHAAWPMLLQYLYFSYTGRNIPTVFAFALYALAFKINAISQVKVLREIGHKHGFLDGDKHERDEIPDVGVSKALQSLMLTTTIRPIFTLMFTYRSADAPTISWWLPLELALYSVVLDFWFYAYHRSCHELDGLWKYHRTHHLTKHPNPMLSAYADHEQEVIEIVVVPVLTWTVLRLVGLPMGFYDWWICHQYIIWAEAFGHSGIRVHGVPPSIASPLLRLFGCELVLEDHDLHHRKGWRQSFNYGKQTRVWDRIFGTCGPRYETQLENVDYSQRVNFPIIRGVPIPLL